MSTNATPRKPTRTRRGHPQRSGSNLIVRQTLWHVFDYIEEKGDASLYKEIVDCLEDELVTRGKQGREILDTIFGTQSPTGYCSVRGFVMDGVTMDNKDSEAESVTREEWRLLEMCRSKIQEVCSALAQATAKQGDSLPVYTITAALFAEFLSGVQCMIRMTGVTDAEADRRAVQLLNGLGHAVDDLAGEIGEVQERNRWRFRLSNN